ncbi:MAG: hypothetical protein OXF73_08095 [Gammaproteobacteria bacterium]|nr:hypothetical protein [Gammaproteobacteria bacterium]
MSDIENELKHYKGPLQEEGGLLQL